MDQNRYVVPAIDHAVSILNYLSKENAGKRLSDISKATGLHPSTCFRILQSLQKNKLVSIDSLTKDYSLGAYLTFLGNRASNSLIDLNVIKPYLNKAVEITKETCMICQRLGEDKYIYLDKKESQRDIRINVSMSRELPLPYTAVGHCFMAYMDIDEVNQVIDVSGGLIKHTPYSIVNLKELDEILEVIRVRGYAISNQGFQLGVSGVAAPIFDSDRNVRLVLSLSCLNLFVNNEDKLHSYGLIIKDIANEITRKITNVI